MIIFGNEKHNDTDDSLDIDNVIDEVINARYTTYNIRDLREDVTDRKMRSVLYSLKPHKGLNPDIWDENGELDKRVRLQLLQIADEFIKYLNIKWVPIDDIILTGSLANYNWSRYSDFDLHILIDYDRVDKKTEFVKEYFNSKKNMWNAEHDGLMIYGFPVELYVQDVNERHDATGIYSLEKEKWLRKPKARKEKSEIDKKKIKRDSVRYVKVIDKLVTRAKYEKDTHKLKGLYDSVDDVYDEIYDMRRKSLSDAGEFGDGNITFKTLRRLGYIDKIRTLHNELFDKINSIEKTKR